MDSFERAHLPRKLHSYSKSEKKTNAVKAQYKQMLQAFKEGDNEGIRTCSVLKPECNFEESLSSYTTSDCLEYSMTTEAEEGTEKPEYDDSESVSDDRVLEDLDSMKGTLSSSSLEESPSIISSPSAAFEESDASDSKLLSTNSTNSDTEYEGFDAEGILASKILEKLKKKLVKISEEELWQDESMPEAKQSPLTHSKEKENYNPTQYLTEEYYNDSGSWKQVIKDLNETKKPGPTKIKTISKTKPVTKEFTDSDEDDSKQHIESDSSSLSATFISVMADSNFDTHLDELVGEYMHPTIRNISSEKVNIIGNTTISNTFPSYMTGKELKYVTMSVDQVYEDEEVDSLQPEVDDDLTLEDLNIEADSKELMQESIALNSIIQTESDNCSIADDSTAAAEYVQMKLFHGKAKFILVMRHPSELYIHGKVQIRDLQSTTEIAGYKMAQDSVDVYAPYCYYAHCLKTIDNPHGVNPELCHELAAAGLSEEDVIEIVSNVDEHTAVVELCKLPSSKLEFVSSNFKSVDLFTKRGENVPNFLRKAAEFLGCSLYLTPPKRKFEEKKIWDDVYSSIICRKERSRGIICGGKSTGKSTFLRHYVNTLLADGPILVVDLDPGQSEFTVPGSLSATVVETPLIGPSFTHLKTPQMMLNIGMINTMDDAKRYLSAISQLITHCSTNLTLREMPWVINTMGMCNNMGLTFMTYIILLIQPTFLFQIDSKVAKKTFGIELDPITVTQMYKRNSQNSLFREIENPYCLHYSFIIARPETSNHPGFGSKLLPRDERYLNILAYFGELFHQHGGVKSILDIVPYEVYIKDLNFALNVKIPEDSIAKVVNGKIVALCQLHQTDNTRVFTLKHNALICHGHGLIRNIDFIQGILYILTPTPIEILKSVNTLLYSDWMPELRGQEKEPLPSGIPIPYRTTSNEMYQRKLMFPPRRRFNPLQLVKMSRNS